jgi:hypothetical protein
MRRAAAGAGGTTGAKGKGDGGGAVIPMAGLVKIKATIEEIGTSPPIARPEAEDLPLRQRTVPEEKTLLGGLPRSAPPPRGAP